MLTVKQTFQTTGRLHLFLKADGQLCQVKFFHCLLVILIKDVGCKSGIIVDFKFHNLSLHFLEALGRTFGRKVMEVLPSLSLVPPPPSFFLVVSLLLFILSR